MSRALTGGLSAGTSLAIALRLLDQAERFAPARHNSCALDLLEERRFSLDIPSLLLGILLGFLIWPILEILVSLRILLQQAVQRRLQPVSCDRTLPPGSNYRLR